MAKKNGPSFGGNAQVITQNLCDLTADNKKIKRTGSVTIKPMKETLHKVPSASFHCTRDPKTGIFYGDAIAQNPDGSYKFRRIVITGHKFYNLEIENDAREFYIMQHAPFVKGSPCLAPGTQPMFYIEDPEVESDLKLKKAEVAVGLTQKILDMKESELKHWGILYGIDPMHNTPSMIKVQLLEQATINPVLMKERFENTERTILHTLVKRAIRVGAITSSLDKGFLWQNGIPMGFNEIACVDKLMIEKDFAINVESEVKLKEKDFKSRK